MKIEKWLKENGKSLKAKTVVLTGATGGLGKEICLLLARFEANVILAARDKAKTEDLIAQTKQKYGNFNAKFVELDLNNFSSVDACIERLKSLGGIDVLIHNAGIYKVPIKTLDSGFNNVFQVNFLYPYYMTTKLLPELRKKKDSVVVALGSVAYKYSKIREEDIDFSNEKKCSKTYGNSKKFLMYALHELFKEEQTVKLSIVHPGVTLTNITNHYPKFLNGIIKFAIKIAFPKPKQAVLSVLKGINDSCEFAEWIGPSIFDVWGKPKKNKIKKYCHDESEFIGNFATETIKILEEKNSN